MIIQVRVVLKRNKPTNLTNNRRIETDQPNYTIMTKLTNQFQWIRLITSSTDKHYSLDSDDFHTGCRNVSHQQQFFQNYPRLDDHTMQTSNTPGFKPFTISNALKKLSKLIPGLELGSTLLFQQEIAAIFLVSSPYF